MANASTTSISCVLASAISSSPLTRRPKPHERKRGGSWVSWPINNCGGSGPGSATMAPLGALYPGGSPLLPFPYPGAAGLLPNYCGDWHTGPVAQTARKTAGTAPWLASPPAATAQRGAEKEEKAEEGPLIVTFWLDCQVVKVLSNSGLRRRQGTFCPSCQSSIPL